MKAKMFFLVAGIATLAVASGCVSRRPTAVYLVPGPPPGQCQPVSVRPPPGPVVYEAPPQQPPPPAYQAPPGYVATPAPQAPSTYWKPKKGTVEYEWVDGPPPAGYVTPPGLPPGPGH